ncbi:MAG TPA: hydroxymethylbilane synthase [Candidatus Polarisedimenticolia bacterium]|nr:hydroxymethylbilane synthase [Candidatus Polarisedimenticolia bacterium]
MTTVVIGSRASRLALWQANWVRDRLDEAGVEARIEVIRTSGDRIVDRPLASLGGKGIFVKEIEEALLEGFIDLAVHSLKDLPTAQPQGLRIACVPRREDPRDVLVAPGRAALGELRPGAVLGTGSPRRVCQIRAVRPDLAIRDLRGNVDTRIARLKRGDYDAVVLALAGLRRLGADVEGTVLDFDQMIPAVGQGALAIETRDDAAGLTRPLQALHDEASAAAVAAERAFLRGLGGGCQAPIAAIGEVRGDRLFLRGLVGDAGTGAVLHDRAEGGASDAEGIGARLAQALLGRGAGDLVRRSAAPPPGEA